MSYLKIFLGYLFGIRFIPQQQLINFNRKKLNEEMVKIADGLFQYKEDPLLVDILALLRIGRDVSILDCATTTNQEVLTKIQAKIDVYSEIRSFIITAIDRKTQETKEGKKSVKGTFNSFRRVNNQAGSAV